MRIFRISLILLLLSSYAVTAYSSNTSSYLISKAAIASFDYETVSEYYSNDNYDNLNIIDLNQSIVSFINSNKLENAKSIANKIISLEKNHEYAWLIILTSAYLRNDFKFFKKFENLEENKNLKLIYHIFYENNQIIKNNIEISKNFFELILSSESLNFKYKHNADYYLSYLNLALYFHSNFNDALYYKAQIYQSLGYLDKAEQIYSKIEFQNRFFISAQKNIVIIKKNNLQFLEAENLLIKYIKIYPNNNSLILLLADVYRMSKQYLKAIETYSSLIRLENINNDELWNIYYKRGICFERSNNWSKAEKDFLEALKLNPKQSQVLNYLAYGWIEKNIKLDKSIEMLNIAVKNEPESHYILDSLAWAYYKKNNFYKAVKIMEKVIELAPGEAISLDHLGDIYLSLGRKREAYFMWLQALELSEIDDNIDESIKNKIANYNAG